MLTARHPSGRAPRARGLPAPSARSAGASGPELAAHTKFPKLGRRAGRTADGEAAGPGSEGPAGPGAAAGMEPPAAPPPAAPGPRPYPEARPFGRLRGAARILRRLLQRPAPRAAPCRGAGKGRRPPPPPPAGKSLLGCNPARARGGRRPRRLTHPRAGTSSRALEIPAGRLGARPSAPAPAARARLPAPPSSPSAGARPRPLLGTLGPALAAGLSNGGARPRPSGPWPLRARARPRAPPASRSFRVKKPVERRGSKEGSSPCHLDGRPNSLAYSGTQVLAPVEDTHSRAPIDTRAEFVPSVSCPRTHIFTDRVHRQAGRSHSPH